MVLFSPYIKFLIKDTVHCAFSKYELQLLFNNDSIEQCRMIPGTPGKDFLIIAAVILFHHFILISSASTVHKNTHNLRCSNQLFQNCPILNLDLALGNLATELYCWVPLFHQWGKVLLFELYLILIISRVELDTTEFNNAGYDCFSAEKAPGCPLPSSLLGLSHTWAATVSTC